MRHANSLRFWDVVGAGFIPARTRQGELRAGIEPRPYERQNFSNDRSKLIVNY